MKIYIMCGIPGSGKSTYTEKNLKNVTVISRDIFREKFGMAKPGQKKVGTPSEEKLISMAVDKNILKCAILEQDFVIDDTNTGKYRKSLIDFLRITRPKAEIIGINMKTPLDVCIKRREGQIPENVMRKIHNKTKFIDKSEVDKLINVEYRGEN